MSVKLLHLSCALLTFVFFSVRGIWMLSDSSLLQHKMVKISPHIIDTVLLVSGLVMAFAIYDTFYTQNWLLIKIAALLCYIVTGSIALKYGPTKRIRGVALLVSWLIFIYIVLVARTRNPLIF